MAHQFIMSKLIGNMIDIKHASTHSGAHLDAYPQKTTQNDNQLWEFVPDPDGSGYFLIESKLNGNVISIQGGATASLKSGTPIVAAPEKKSGVAGQRDFQLWQFLEDPAGSGYCFIMSKLDGDVIDIKHSSTEAGAALVSYPMKTSGADNQLWTVVGGPFPKTVSVAAAPSSGLGSHSNYILSADCKPLINLFVQIDVTEDIVCQSASGSTLGFSFQLNCYSPKKSIVAYQQYVLGLIENNLCYNVNNWPVGGPALINLGTPTLMSLPTARIPAGYQLLIGFGNDTVGNVTGAFWIVRDNLGNTLANVTQDLTSFGTDGLEYVAPVVAFELNLVGPYNLEKAVLSSGAGTFLYVVERPKLTALSARPACTESSAETGETANSRYGALPASPNLVLKQTFNVLR
jgi:Ricin-type beta-trefoil lectin domain-like